MSDAEAVLKKSAADIPREVEVSARNPHFLLWDMLTAFQVERVMKSFKLK